MKRGLDLFDTEHDEIDRMLARWAFSPVPTLFTVNVFLWAFVLLEIQRGCR